MQVAAGALVVATLVWTARKLQWRRVPWVVVGLIVLILSWHAQLGIDSRFGDMVESWTRRPKMMGMMMMMMPAMSVCMFRMQLP